MFRLQRYYLVFSYRFRVGDFFSFQSSVFGGQKTAAARAGAVILMFLIACVNCGLGLRSGLNNHLININYHQKIFISVLSIQSSNINQPIHYPDMTFGNICHSFLFLRCKSTPTPWFVLEKNYKSFVRIVVFLTKNLRFFNLNKK